MSCHSIAIPFLLDDTGRLCRLVDIQIYFANVCMSVHFVILPELKPKHCRDILLISNCGCSIISRKLLIVGDTLGGSPTFCRLMGIFEEVGVGIGVNETLPVLVSPKQQDPCAKLLDPFWLRFFKRKRTRHKSRVARFCTAPDQMLCVVLKCRV